MDIEKIARFITERRKAKGFTQLELAEKLHITDRAVSKWETARALPDSSIMLSLCDILGVTVNDLLSGEIVSMDNYNKELENKLLDVLKEKERADKHLLKLEWVIGVLSIVVLMTPIFLGAFLPLLDWQRLVIIFSGFIPALIGFGFALKIEQVAGYYECKKCGNRYVPTYKAMARAMHMGRTRYLKCPKCGRKSWQKKVLGREDK